MKRTSAPGKAGALVIFSFASALFGAFRLRGLGLRCGGVGRVDVMIQILDEAAAALVLLFLEPLPLREDVVIELEHRAGLGKAHAVAVAALTDMIHHDGIDALGAMNVICKAHRKKA